VVSSGGAVVGLRGLGFAVEVATENPEKKSKIATKRHKNHKKNKELLIADTTDFMDK